MTNTRITDPEILETRYPIIVHKFGLRLGSGGIGRFSGGDGIVRDLEFREPLHVSILSERRTHSPTGLCGGCDGSRGCNLWIRFADEKKQLEHFYTTADPILGQNEFESEEGIFLFNIGGKNAMEVGKGNRLIVLTPGGGGYGQ